MYSKHMAGRSVKEGKSFKSLPEAIKFITTTVIPKG